MMLKAVNIHKEFRHSAKTLPVLGGINLSIASGELVTIVGPSGAGKTTLLHILGGLDKPTQGHVYLDDQDIYSLNDTDRSLIRNGKIGFIFQFYHLLPDFTALENILLPALIRRPNDKIATLEKRGFLLLEQLGLKARAQHKPQELSGGEQQRVAIARALINEPRIIFCDEPTGNLDSETGAEIIKMLKRLNDKNKQTLVIVTHDDQLSRLSHRTIRMKDGVLQ